MKKIIFVLFIIIACFCTTTLAQKSIWTPNYEAKLFSQIDASFKARMPDDEKRKALVSFMVKRFKEELPRGMDSVTGDSLRILSIKLGQEYGYANPGASSALIPTLRPWTKEIEAVYRESLLKALTKENQTDAVKFCDCMITEIKKTYPDSLMIPLPQDLQLKAAGFCKSTVFK